MVPLSQFRDLQNRIRQLECLLGRKTVEIEILKETVQLGREKKTDLAAAIARTRRFHLREVARVMDVSRSNLTNQAKISTASRSAYVMPDDVWLMPIILEIATGRSTYGYRRITVLLNRKLVELKKPTVNHKRIYRIMKQHRLLLQRHTGKPTGTHDGKVITLHSNTRWCSDAFAIQCRNGDRVHVVFSLDTCDREAIRYLSSTIGVDGEMVRDLMVESIEARFGRIGKLSNPVQWLSDNGPCYTANETIATGRMLGFEICTTPAYSPESNGMAEAFVKTFKRDYVWFGDLASAQKVMEQLAGWFEDYNERAPHKGLKMMSPRQFVKANSAAATLQNCSAL